MNNSTNFVILQDLVVEASAYCEVSKAEYKTVNIVNYELRIDGNTPLCSFVDEHGCVFCDLYLRLNNVFQPVDTSCSYCGNRYRLGVTAKDAGGCRRPVKWDSHGFYVDAWSLDGKRTHFKKYLGERIEVGMHGVVVNAESDWFGYGDELVKHFESYTYTDENGNKIVKTENAANHRLTAGETESLQKLLNNLNDFCSKQNIKLVMDTNDGCLRAFHGTLSFDGDADASEFPAYLTDIVDCSCMDYGCCDEAVVIK